VTPKPGASARAGPPGTRAGGARPPDPFAGDALWRDVQRYAAFGVHRYGSPGERAAMDWIERELRAAGLAASAQALRMPRQYVLEHAEVRAGGAVLPAFPHWWIPQASASFELGATLARDGEDAHGRLLWLRLPHDGRSYLSDTHRAAIARAAARGPAAILLTIDNPADEIFTYNVDQADPPWPVPVIVLAPAHAPLLEDARRDARPLAVAVRGRYERDVPGRNVIGRLDRGAARTVVVSTPVSSWFTSTCERAPGIASFLALARHAAAARADANFVFAATAGHEIGHGGMEAFLRAGAPPAAAVAAWIHLGACNACHRWRRDGEVWRTDGTVDASRRLLVVSPSLREPVEAAFDGVDAKLFVADEVGIGELREVKAAGYPAFFGVAGSHRFFHTPADGVETTSAAALEPVARAFARALDALLAR